jgi:hypothetical protein
MCKYGGRTKRNKFTCVRIRILEAHELLNFCMESFHIATIYYYMNICSSKSRYSPYTNLNLMCNGFSYSSRLNDLQSLNERRNFFDIDLILKTFTYQIDSTGFVGFFKFPTQLRDLRHPNSFLTSISKESSIDWCMRALIGLNIDLNSLCHGSYARARSRELRVIRDQGSS